MDEHARTFVDRLEDIACIEHRLNSLAASGLMIACGDLVHACSGLEDRDPGQFSWLAIPTCSKVEHLLSTLQSYITRLRTFDRKVRVFVADDSRSVGHQARCKQLLKRLSRESGLEFFYAGSAEKHHFAELLSARGNIPREVVSFALFGSGFDGPTIGGNRNAILLHTLDHLVLSVDDDTECEVGRAAESGDPRALEVRNDSLVTESWFFEDRDSAVKAASFCNLDLLREHETLLGRSISSVVNRAIRAGVLQIDDISDRLLKAICLNEGHIAITYNGIVGDTGMYSPIGLVLFGTDETVRHLLSSESAYERALGSRLAIRHARNTTICHGGEAFATVIGLDNRSLLPPFQPVFRGEDHVFNRIISSHFEQDYFGHVPYGILHTPFVQRSYNLHTIAQVRICEVVVHFIETEKGTGVETDRSKCMESLGQQLLEIGSLPLRDFANLLNELISYRADNYLRRLDTLASTRQRAPNFVLAHIRREMNQLLKSLSDERSVTPIEMVGCHSVTQVAQMVREFVKNFGDLLKWWPAMVGEAKLLRKNGYSIGEVA